LLLRHLVRAEVEVLRDLDGVLVLFRRAVRLASGRAGQDALCRALALTRH
jgi:hypothetical protein